MPLEAYRFDLGCDVVQDAHLSCGHLDEANLHLMRLVSETACAYRFNLSRGAR